MIEVVVVVVEIDCTENTLTPAVVADVRIVVEVVAMDDWMRLGHM
jgi:hypothetical protein